MADFDPVEIRLDLIQNVDSEGKKSTAAIDDIAAASNKMKAQFEKDIAAQKTATTKLINELKLLKETMGIKVDSGDGKQIVDKQKLAEQIDLLNKKLIEQEALLTRISKTPISPLPKLNNQVADYARQVNGLKFSMTQISRELPNFAISPMIGIMSLSNNLPMLQGDITRMIELNKQLKASGQATTPVFKQLISSLFSWQTALIAGISALMLWGPQIGSFISNLFKAKDALKLTKDELKGLNESFAKAAGADLGKLKTLFDALKKAKEGTVEYADAKGAIIDQYGDNLKGMDAEIRSLTDVKSAQEELTKAIYETAKAKSLSGLRAELEDKLINGTTPEFEKLSKLLTGGVAEVYRETIMDAARFGKKLSYDAKRVIDSFTTKKAVDTDQVVGTSSSGQVQYAKKFIDVNPVQEAINKIRKAQEETNQAMKDGEKYADAVFGKNTQDKVNDLIKEQEDLLKIAKLKPQATLAELEAKNKEIKGIEDRIKAYKELGVEKDKEPNDKTSGAKEKSERSMIETSKEYLDLQDQIIQKEKELTGAILAGNTDLSLKLVQDITALQKKLNGLGESPTIQPIKAKLATTLVDTKTLAPMKQLTDEQKKQLELLSKQLGLDEVAAENLEDEAKLRQDIAGYALQLIDALRQGMDLTEGQAVALDGAMNVISQLGQGDYIGAAISGITTAVGAIMDTSGIEDRLSKPWEEFENWISRSNDALERYIKLRDEAIGSERYSTSDEAIKEAQDIKAEAEAKLNDMKLTWTFSSSGWFDNTTAEVMQQYIDKQNEIGQGFLDIEGNIKASSIFGYNTAKLVASYDLNQLTTDAEGNFSLDKLRALIANGTVADEAVIEAVKGYDANADKLISLQKEKQQLLTDTMASSIADSIIDGFKNGYDSAADFADNFEGLMQDAVMNAVKIKALEEPLKKWYDQFSLDMESGGGLDENEKSILKKWWDDIVAGGIAASDAAMDAAGIDPDFSSDRTGSTKGIAQASQDSVDELNGRMTAVQAYIYDIRNINQQSFDFDKESKAYEAAVLSQLETIAENTDYCKLLVDVKRVLEDIQLKGVRIKT